MNHQKQLQVRKLIWTNPPLVLLTTNWGQSENSPFNLKRRFSVQITWILNSISQLNKLTTAKEDLTQTDWLRGTLREIFLSKRQKPPSRWLQFSEIQHCYNWLQCWTFEWIETYLARDQPILVTESFAYNWFYLYSNQNNLVVKYLFSYTSEKC